MKDLFDKNLKKDAPLADRIRPQTLKEFVGQEEIVGKGKLLRQAIERDQVPSIIFWGPPGSGKTTLARIIAKMTKSDFVQFSAVTAGLADLRQVIKKAQDNKKFYHCRTILFLDEIHRWNKAQQDALLPHIENGTVTLIGATTENPSFEVISPLLSRSRVFVLEKLTPTQIAVILKRGTRQMKKKMPDDLIKYLSELSDGDARVALNALEFALKASPKIDKEVIKQALQKTHLLYDKAGEEHYNLISALHKTMRASDADAALYWLGRMLEAGEEPLYIARRLIRFASEDIGLADPNALTQAVSAYLASHFIGMPECNLALAQAVAYLARAKKSRALDNAYSQVKQDIKFSQNEPVPFHLRNLPRLPGGKAGAPTKLMKDLGYGKGEGSNLPKQLKGRKYLK